MYIDTYLWLINTFTFRGFTDDLFLFFIDYSKGKDTDTFFGRHQCVPFAVSFGIIKITSLSKLAIGR